MVRTLAADPGDEKESFFQKYKKTICTFLIMLLYITLGVVYGMAFEGEHFVTACYVIIQIVTTIGYGDMSVSSHMRWFMSIYVLMGFLVASNLINDIAKRTVDSSQAVMRQKLREAEARASGDIQDADAAKKKLGEVNLFVAAFFVFAIYLFVGALVFLYVEPCTCSYGKYKEANYPNCTDYLADGTYSFETCKATGGETNDYLSFLYMGIITMTTVGFGDKSPKSYSGRVFGCFWMIGGVLAAGNFLVATSSLIDKFTNKKKKPATVQMGRELFDKIDKDGTGYLNKYEFARFFLAMEKVVDEKEFEKIESVFDDLDVDESGELSFEEIMENFHPDAEDEDD